MRAHYLSLCPHGNEGVGNRRIRRGGQRGKVVAVYVYRRAKSRPDLIKSQIESTGENGRCVVYFVYLPSPHHLLFFFTDLLHEQEKRAAMQALW